jgi:hypothetical protein
MEKVVDKAEKPVPATGDEWDPYDYYDCWSEADTRKQTPKYIADTTPCLKDATAKREAELKEAPATTNDRSNKSATAPSNVVAIAICAPQVSAETVSLLEQLLEEARAGAVIGLAIAVLRSKGNYDQNGEQMAVAGMLAALQKMVFDFGD